jgi:hypothetical protein
MSGEVYFSFLSLLSELRFFYARPPEISFRRIS